MQVNLNCRHFPGDRPCTFHKREQAVCHSCSHFAGVGERILIIKLDALGDVLRTTSLLPSLKTQSPHSHITWMTSSVAAPVLENNPYLDETLTMGAEGLARFQVESFDRILNPDASKRSAALASLAHGKNKRGYVLGDEGQVRPLTDEALEWLELGARDDLKRMNRMTYQEHLHRICGVPPASQRIVLRLSEEERTVARGAAVSAGLRPETPLVGFNTGASGRWPRKRWPRERFSDLAVSLRRIFDGRVLLLGGPLERETNRWVSETSHGFAVDPGWEGGLRTYFALIDLCDVVVTGDTLGLHAALALGKRVVALFGPTSPWEIDMYGQGERITAEMDCICCYRTDCVKSPGCMDRIGVERVLDATRRALERATPAAVSDSEATLIPAGAPSETPRTPAVKTAVLE